VRGDHLSVIDNGLISHAVDAGDGTVFSLVLIGRKNIVVRLAIDDFSFGGPITTVSHKKPFETERILSNAFRCLAKLGTVSEFDESEVFVNWCVEGESNRFLETKQAASMAISNARRVMSSGGRLPPGSAMEISHGLASLSQAVVTGPLSITLPTIVSASVGLGVYRIWKWVGK
jgi:hypothetical protein